MNVFIDVPATPSSLVVIKFVSASLEVAYKDVQKLVLQLVSLLYFPRTRSV